MRTQALFFSLLLTVATGIVFGFRSSAPSYPSLSDGVLVDITPDPLNSAQLLAASSKGVYRRGDDRRWREVLNIPQDAGSVQRLIRHPIHPEKVFLITEEGVLEGNLKTSRSQWIFYKVGGLENPVHALAVHPEKADQIYVATDRGLFITKDAGRTWLRPYRWPENEPIRFVTFLPFEPPVLILGTSRELFLSKDSGETFESGFSLSLSGEKKIEDLVGSSIEEEDENREGNPPFSAVAFSSDRPIHVWIGTEEGVFESEDGGIVWQRLPDQGLEDRRIHSLVFSSQSGLLGASRREVARFDLIERRWKKLPVGFTDPPVSITMTPSAQNGNETLWVASGREVYESILPPIELGHSQPLFLPSPERLESFKKLFDQEPTIRELQKAAIRYASLGNGKIRRWHWGSRMRAFIPRLSFGKSLSIGSNVDIDRGSTNDPDRFIFGPEDFDRGWDLGLTWELGDLLYSSAQTSIDSRAKLLVELRESILSQVTRLYFERRRVQWEIAASPASSPQEHFDRLLRLDELTAQIDALTDGFLSKQLEVIRQNHPEIDQLTNFVSDQSNE